MMERQHKDNTSDPAARYSTSEDTRHVENDKDFSWLVYLVFMFQGIAMLWAWNMFLAASPYFQHRFASSPRLLSAYSPTLLSVSTVVSLVSILVLTQLQANADYARRIKLSLVLNSCTFTLLALSTVLLRSIGSATYFVFLMLMVFFSSLATAFCQNGVYSYVTGFGQSDYARAIMTGQGIAGVLPPLAQIISVLSVPPVLNDTLASKTDEAVSAGGTLPVQSGKSAFAYFLTATAVALIALLAFTYILRPRHPGAIPVSYAPINSDENDHEDVPQNIAAPTPQSQAIIPTRKSISLWTLYRKLHWHANAVFLTFCITMFFPVYTQQISTVHSTPLPTRLLSPPCFIPLAFLCWNIGDLSGRIAISLPYLRELVRWPKLLLGCSIVRVGWIPLYTLCNLHGRGARVSSDAFYFLVQFTFGLSSGIVGATSMMAPVSWLELEEEREAAGGFMGLMLVAGLTVGSLLSFCIA